MFRRALALAASLVLLSAGTARADITGFIGATTTPANRAAKGVAVGMGLLIVGFEFEYANTTDDPAATAPSLTTGTVNVLFQTPMAIFGFQPYFETGAGVYHESLDTYGNTGFALDTGGGVKMSLIGPLRLRVDYRLFKLANGPMYSAVHRVYAGLNLKF